MKSSPSIAPLVLAILMGLPASHTLAQSAVPKFFNATQELQNNASTNQPAPGTASTPLEKWWNDNSATYEWLGLGNRFKDYGLTVGGDYQGNYYGNTTGGYRTGRTFDEQIKLGFIYDFKTLFGINGLKAYSNLRYRDGNDINAMTGAVNGFGPSTLQTGKELRLMSQYLEYVTDNNVLMVNAGWINAYDMFLQQPLSKLFQNNEITSTKGIGGNMGAGARQFWSNNSRYNGNAASKIPWGSSYASWGGTLRLKPMPSTYAMSGLYMAIPNNAGSTDAYYTPTSVAPYTSTSKSKLGTVKTPGTMHNNGVSNFGGAGWNAVGAGQPNGNDNGNPNGLYSVSEVGWEPKVGKDKLEGKYAFGMIWWGVQNQNFESVSQSGSGVNAKAYNSGHFNMGSWAWYFQADQMIYRAKEPDTTASTTDGKSVPEGKDPAESTDPSLSKKGLYLFNAWAFSPCQYSLLDLYYQTGVVYQGLIPGRPEDRMGLALGTAWFSPQASSAYSQTQAINDAAAFAGKKTVFPNAPQSSWGGVLEFDYQLMINKWMSVKPFAEYIMNPQENGTLGNDFVLGAQIATRF